MPTAKLISSIIADQLSVVLTRRGFATAATATQGTVSGSVKGRGVGMMKNASEESRKSPWVPDPVTGYYKPEGQASQVDAVDLRELIMKQKGRQN